ncbi:MAG: S8 family serine peptidase [Thermomicrobiales bacterium]|nr:S8 family serine peptidase [Thermomicrobiales bacterium]
MRRLILPYVLPALLLFSLLTPLAASAGDVAISGPDAALIAKANSEGPLLVIATLTSVAAQQSVLDALDGQDATLRVRYELFPLLALTAGPDALTTLARSADVVSITEDVPQDPGLASTIPVINGDDVQSFGWTGAGQTVAILDTGIDANHPFFGGRVVEEACYSRAGGAGTGVSLCPDGNDAQTGSGAADANTAQCLDGATNICDHGTHVAGIAAGNGAGVSGAPGNGVAPGANIIAIQVFTRHNTVAECDPDDPNSAPCVKTYSSDQILGLQRVLALSASRTIAAVNMSLGSGMNTTSCDTDARKTAIDALLAVGIATVIAAGNEGYIDAVGTPGCISTAITVGSTTDADTVSGFSNRGPLLDIFAPGSGVDSSVPDDAWGNMSGTSMATPHVVGAFAVLRQVYPTASVATLLEYMKSTGVPITYAIDTANPTTMQTTPRLDLLGAIQAGNAAPILTVNSSSVTTNEGSSAGNAGTWSDADIDPVTFTASVGSVTGISGNMWIWSFTPDDGPSDSQVVTITGTDNKGSTGTVTFQLNVVNVAPTASISAAPTTLNEGDPFTVSLTNPADVSVADTTTGFTYSFDCATGGGYSAYSVTANRVCPTTDNAVLSVGGRIQDKDGGVSTYNTTVTVLNVPPTVGAITAPTGPVFVGSLVYASAPFTDPGIDDTHTSSWNWGDGSVTTGTAGGNLATGSHVYTSAGLFTIVVTVTDDDGGSGSSTFQYLISVDPAAGTLLGAGKFMSPTGAWTERPTSMAGEFRFNIWYPRGATVPTGYFEYELGGSARFESPFHFRSSTFDWLVLTPDVGYVSGRGTLNGRSGFGFWFGASDGPDKLRVKIWNLSTGVVIYDNQPGDDIAANPQLPLKLGTIVITRLRLW